MKTAIVVLLVLGTLMVTLSLGGTLMSRDPSWMNERFIEDGTEPWERWDSTGWGFVRCHRAWSR